MFKLTIFQSCRDNFLGGTSTKLRIYLYHVLLSLDMSSLENSVDPDKLASDAT